MRLTGYCHAWFLDVFRVGFTPYTTPYTLDTTCRGRCISPRSPRTVRTNTVYRRQDCTVSGTALVKTTLHYITILWSCRYNSIEELADTEILKTTLGCRLYKPCPLCSSSLLDTVYSRASLNLSSSQNRRPSTPKPTMVFWKSKVTEVMLSGSAGW